MDDLLEEVANRERWREIDGFPGYEVSTKGRVRSYWNNAHKLMDTPHYLTRVSDKDGYARVHIHTTTKNKCLRVNRLVATAFIPNPENKPQVNHINGIKGDDRVENLEWVTLSENRQHAYDTGLQHPPGEQPIRIVETGEEFKSISECAKAINGIESGIRHCLYGERHTHKNLHFEYIGDKPEPKRQSFLYDYQMDAVMRLKNGNILCGGVGSGKSRSGLFYYFKENGGWIDENGYVPMKNPQDLYIITTAKKRDSLEFERELSHFLMSTNPEVNYYNNKVMIDSWNRISNYVDVEGGFFLLDEQRLVGSGSWVRSFLKIAKKNNWILLTATPGDTYHDYLPVFLANGYFKNKTEFNREHVIYSRFTKYPKVDRYVGTTRLDRLRRNVLVQMKYKHQIRTHHEDIYVNHDLTLYKETMKKRWNPYKEEPFQTASDLCYTLRRIVNSDPSRGEALVEIVKKKRKVIVFYSFDFELDILKNLDYGPNVEIAELNGHAHQPVPERSDWVYLVNYAAGAEAWECTRTDTIVFYSQHYSYKIMTQAAGRIDRLNTPYSDLHYFHLKSRSGIDLAISKALKEKRTFNEKIFANW